MKRPQQVKAMIVAGVMSGTSADGVDVAICCISATKDGVPKLKVLGHRGFAFEKRLKAAILAAASGELLSAAEFTRLSWRLGEVYASCVAAAAQELHVELQLVACHGQTIYHQGAAKRYLGAPLRCTWQIGEASVLAERLRVPVVSDFRPADMAVGGQGAPLVPMLDFCMFRHATRNRLLLNLGGIANMTVLPAGCGIGEVMAFDSGPANMVIDAVMQELYSRSLDEGGAVAASGSVLQHVVDQIMEVGYFSALPPKSCGREEFGAAFVERLLKLCAGAKKRDIVATATALTSASVVDAYTRFVAPQMGDHLTEMLVAGGGAKNETLMRSLQAGLPTVRVSTTDAAGLAVEAKEAAAFALLGWLTRHGLPGNVPSATGAKRAVVLGKVTSA